MVHLLLDDLVDLVLAQAFRDDVLDRHVEDHRILLQVDGESEYALNRLLLAKKRKRVRFQIEDGILSVNVEQFLVAVPVGGGRGREPVAEQLAQKPVRISCGAYRAGDVPERSIEGQIVRRECGKSPVK